MREKMTRRDALKLGTSAALGATVAPLLASAGENMRSESCGLSRYDSNVMARAVENEICFIRARDLAALIREKKISSREVMQAHLKQIARVNPRVNAMVTLVPENQLMAQALVADE